tara:strand:- start:198 stop:467 length:270 start_codon:yes stop_codon:yes gene_type:complete
MAKKVVKKKKTPDIDIKVRNLDKVIKADKKNKKKVCCSTHSCGGCWMFGSALAMILSYTRSESILWAILHGIFSWFYVLFRAMQIWGWF